MIIPLLNRLRAVSLLASFLAIVVAGAGVLPLALDAWAWVRAADDPVALTERGLAEDVDPGRFDAEIRAAVDDGDIDLAESFLDLADRIGHSVDPLLRAEVERAAAERAYAAGGDFLRGVIFGEAESVSGLAGAVTGDLVGIGDVRDFTREGWRVARGEPADEMILALSAAGLVVSGATWGSFGAAAPARAGLTVLKSAKTAGRLSPRLAARLGGLAGGALDAVALRRSVAAAGRFDLTAARKAAGAVLRPSHVGPLLDAGRDVARVTAKAGYRATDDVLALAHAPTDLARAARLSERYEGATRAVVKLFGRGALVLTRAMAELVGWLFAAAGWALALASWCAEAGRSLARMTHRRSRIAAPPRGMLAPVAQLR